MKKILVLVMISLLFLGVCFLVITAKDKQEIKTLPAAVEEKQEIKPLPDYSLEGIDPKVRYYEWDERYDWWTNLYNLSDAKGPVMKVEKFYVDRNKDGVADLKIIKYYMPDGKYKNDQNRIGTHKAYQWMVIYVDDDLDKLWDRALSDKVDASGKLGMDGVFEKEEEVRY